jgi:hypothetical protein
MRQSGNLLRQSGTVDVAARLTYRFDLFNDGGARDCLFIAECFGDEHAVLLARALFESSFVRMKCIKVWRDDVLVHEAEKPKSGRSKKIN